MKYLDGSFSISLSAWGKSLAVKATSLYNLTLQRKFDAFMKANFREKYMLWKERLAIKMANKALKSNKPK